MLQIFGQMMMMPISMATAGMNMMTGTLGGARGESRAGGGNLARWLGGGCCGSREGPKSGASASLDSGGSAGWTARESSGGSSSYRSGSDFRPGGGDYRSGSDYRPATSYRSGNEERSSAEYRSGSESRAGSSSGSASDRDCGCGKRSGGGECGCGSKRSRNHGHYREERRMSDCSCCEDRHTTVYLVKYWIVNVRHCAEKHFVGEGVRAFADEIEGCNLDTWLLGEWIREHPNEVPGVEQKYLRIKVERLDSWPTMDDCCDRHRGPREVDVLQNINKTLEKYLGGRHGGAYESTQSAAS